MTSLQPYRHVSLLPDGNGRWAQQRGLPRTVGHQAGAANFIQLLPDLAQLPIDILSLYLFSTENWRRPKAEIAHIFQIVEHGITDSLPLLSDHDIRIRHIGELADLPHSLQKTLLTACEATRANDGLLLVIAINYSGRYEVVRATRQLLLNGVPAEAVDEQCLRQHFYIADLPDPEIILRTGGEYRLSNWMIWQTAHTLLRSLPIFWPDLTFDTFCQALWTTAKPA